ncbi:redox-regulated ATPase YchF [Candidatus Wolfebacteria bacterium]|nr:redox-regulated ATPase YchF [Candidatus Wolfebacteria bacterium]
MKIGIVGLPNVGKSTLFKLLTKQEINIANYPFATIDPNVGVVSVPDERLDKLAVMSRSKKIVPAIVEFYDIAGLVKGANKGEGLGNQFLSHIRDVQAIVHVVRCFKDDSIIHVEQDINPVRDIDTVMTELILKDLEAVKKRREKLEGEARTGDKAKIKDLDIIRKVEEGLNHGIPVRIIPDAVLEPVVREMMLLTAKPQLFLLNGDETDATPEIKEKADAYLVMNLNSSPDPSPLIRRAYEILGLISFFTTGEDESRAWTIERGIKAAQAAGVIHSDFEKKFIRAEVIHWEKLLEAGHGSPSTNSGQLPNVWAIAKQKGWLRVEGKEYVVQDGDVMEIRHG